MTDLQHLDPELRKYLRVTRLPEVYEALLAGLSIMQPENPCKWIADKLYYLQEVGISNIDWDSFIDEDKKPKESPFAVKGISGFFGGGDGAQFGKDADAPTPEMISKAYLHYNRKSFKKFFDEWLQFHLHRRERAAAKRAAKMRADRHFFHSRIGRIFSDWLEWTRFCKGRQAMATEILQRVLHTSVVRVMFKAWHGVSLEARKTREYFERELRRLERGDNVGDEDELTKATGEARDDLSAVPEVIRLQILGHLALDDMARAACVCRAWKTHTQTPELQHKLNFGKIRHKATAEVIKRMLSNAGSMLAHVSLVGCSGLTADTFRCLSGCKNLQDVNLSECSSVTDDAVGQLVQGCPLLMYINLSYTAISDNAMRLLAQHACSLQFISLAACSNITDKGMGYLANAAAAAHLQLIDLSLCVQLSSASIIALSASCPRVKRWLLNDLPALTTECLLSMSSHSSAEQYELLGCSEITDEGIRSVCSKQLQVLKVDKNDYISDAAFASFGRRSPDLQHLHAADCQRLSDHAIRGLSPLKQLRVLNLADCVRVSDAGAKAIAESAFAGSLRELNLTNAVRLTDHGVMAICKRATGLTYVRLSFCENLTQLAADALTFCQSLVCADLSGTSMNDTAMSILATLPKLRFLYLASCDQVTDLGVQKLAQQLRNLEQLDLSHCVQITDGAVRSLSFSCRLLTHLSLRGCRQLTDLSMQYVSGVCQYLVFLDLSECVMITDKSLKYLKKACKRLETLLLLCCQGISKASVMRMTRRIAKVQHSTEDPPIHFFQTQPH